MTKELHRTKSNQFQRIELIPHFMVMKNSSQAKELSKTYNHGKRITENQIQPILEDRINFTCHGYEAIPTKQNN